MMTKAFISGAAPMCAVTTNSEPSATPAAAASAQPTANASPMTRSMPIPISRAAKAFSATARIALPDRVFFT